MQPIWGEGALLCPPLPRHLFRLRPPLPSAILPYCIYVICVTPPPHVPTLQICVNQELGTLDMHVKIGSLGHSVTSDAATTRVSEISSSWI